MPFVHTGQVFGNFDDRRGWSESQLRVSTGATQRADYPPADKLNVDPPSDLCHHATDRVAQHDGQLGQHLGTRRSSCPDLSLDERDSCHLGSDHGLAVAGTRVGDCGGLKAIGRPELT